MAPMKFLLGAVFLLALPAAAAASPSTPKTGITFIEDDYAKALGKARAEKKPLFIEAWAPWCHTCRAMRSTVFPDDALAPEAGRFVFFAWDTEKAQNAGLKKKYPVQALPSFFVVDPATETPALRWVGGATVPQMRRILDDGARALAARATAGLQAELRKADRLYAAGSDKEAAAAYRAVLGKAPKDWKPWGRAAESLLFALQRTGDAAGCAAFAREAWDRLRTTSSSANVAAIGLECARGLPASDTGRVTTVAGFTKACREVLDSKVSVAPDDRAAVYDALLSEREEAKDEAGKREIAVRMAAFLEQEASRAQPPDARASLDSWRITAYLAAGTPEKAVEALQRSEKELPDDYNPPARLALVYKEMKRWDEALAASDRALAKVYGPRKLNVLRVRIDIYAGMGDKDAAKKTVEESLAYAEALPEGQRSEQVIASLRKKLGGMS